MKIAVVFDADGPMAVCTRHLDLLREACPNTEIRFVKEPSSLISEGYQADVLICWATGGKFSCGSYCAYDKSLHWIHCLSAGAEGLMADPIVSRPGLLVTCSKGIHGIPMANHVMGYILSFLRRFPDLAINQKEQIWQRPMPDEATGKQLCIIGIGCIGKEIARVAKCFDMRVVGIKRSVTPVENVDEVLPAQQLNTALAASDFVVMLLPFNEATEGFMSRERFSAMKKGAVFINVGRGQTVDEAAMIEALESGRLGGAALDTFCQEPLPPDSPLWSMPNVIISPHIAADTPLYMDRAFQLAAKNLQRYQSGQPLISQVDLINRY